MHENLYQGVESFFARAMAARPGSFACRASCHGCCHGDLYVYAVEAKRIAAAFASLPLGTRQACGRRGERGEHCALLDPRSHRCLVYDDRPLVCRGFGLATLFEGEVTWCPLNYTKQAPRAVDILDLEELNRRLTAIERRGSGGRLRRVRLATIVQASTRKRGTVGRSPA
ncbi:MAG: YkgJ family cysteine cluster protein [Deltaproteobacteria bacterium]|nr:YkgJ family cysteine cluster protein [Deltaproteobacteria bacterium]